MRLFDIQANGLLTSPLERQRIRRRRILIGCAIVLFGCFLTFAPQLASEAQAFQEADGGSGGESGEKKSALRWLFESLGALYIIVFLVLSFTLVALFVMNLISARRETVCPDHLIENLSLIHI